MDVLYTGNLTQANPFMLKYMARCWFCRNPCNYKNSIVW